MRPSASLHYLRRFAVEVLERLHARDEAETAEEDLVRTGVVTDVVRVLRPVREVGQAGVAGAEAVRDAGARRPRDDMASADWMRLLRLGLMRVAGLRRRPELERALPVEDDEELLLGRVAV